MNRRAARNRARPPREPRPPVRLPAQTVDALTAAKVKRDKALSDLRRTFVPRIEDLYTQWAADRRKVWAAFDEQRQSILEAADKQAA